MLCLRRLADRGRRIRSASHPSCGSPKKSSVAAAYLLDFFDRCAKLCSLNPPPAAVAYLARHARVPRKYRQKKPPLLRGLMFWQGQKDSNPRHAVLETAALPTELYPYIHFCDLIILSQRKINVKPFFEFFLILSFSTVNFKILLLFLKDCCIMYRIMYVKEYTYENA